MTTLSRFPRLSARSRLWIFRLLSFLIVLGLWQLLAGSLNSLLFPSPFDTFSALARLGVTANFWGAVWLSNQALLLGFSAAAVCGVPLGLLIGRSRLAEQMIDPYLNILLATPMSALIPVMILAFGLGLWSRVLVVVLFSIVVIVVNTRMGLRTLEPVWIEMAHSFGAREWQLWLCVLLPGALPGIATGLRLGLGRALTGMVAVELTLVAVGIGRLILDYQGTFEAGSVYATVLVLVAEALLLFHGLRALERKLIPWQNHSQVE